MYVVLLNQADDAVFLSESPRPAPGQQMFERFRLSVP